MSGKGRCGNWAWLLVSVGLAVVACGRENRRPPSEVATSTGGDAGEGTGGDAGEPVAPFEGAAEQYWGAALKALSARQDECIGIPADYGPSGDGKIATADYLIGVQVAWRRSLFQAGFDAGRLHLDGQLEANCLHRLAEESCADVRRDFALDRNCIDGALVGSVPRDGACARSDECAAASDACTDQDEGKLGQCEPRAELGQSCEVRTCTQNAVCVTQSTPSNPLTFTCVAQAAAGAPCGSTADCTDGSFCNGACHAYADDLSCTQSADCPYYLPCLIDPGETSGHCGRGRGEGEPCRQGADGDDCAFALSCRPGADGALVCTSVWVKLGEQCRNLGANQGLACLNSNCDVRDGETQEGVCVAFDQLGEPCTGDDSCAPGLKCGSAGCELLSN